MDDKYKQSLLVASDELSTKADVFRDVKTLSESIVSTNDDSAVIDLLHTLSVPPKDMGQDAGVVDAIRDVHKALLMYCGHEYVRGIFDRHNASLGDSRTLQELLLELNSLIGLETVKSKVRDLIAYQQVQRLRRDHGLFSEKQTLHLAFTGNPGTGKTTVARIVGRIYRQIGLLSKGHFVEASRTDLIAGYQGQTALKVKRVIERARGGVLFIDEAYSITENDHSDSYGRECLTELTKALEDCRDDLVVIVAGYSKPMEKFFESNPGLKSRFNTFIEFPDYSEAELDAIFTKICRQNNYAPTEELLARVHLHFEKEIDENSENFANGRMVRNLFEAIVMNHARRCAEIEKPSIKDLSEMIVTDFSLPNVQSNQELVVK